MSGRKSTRHLPRPQRRLFQLALGVALAGAGGGVARPAQASSFGDLLEWFESGNDPFEKVDLPDFDGADYELTDLELLFMDPKDLAPVFKNLSEDLFPGQWNKAHEDWFMHLENTVFARDEVPPACAEFQEKNGCWGTFRTHRIYQKGVRKGRRLVLKAWAKHNQCGDLDAFVDQINHALIEKRPQQQRPKKLCRYGGFSDGVMDALTGIRERCAMSCGDDGRHFGKVSAGLYCSFSQLSDGLVVAADYVRGPVNLCGQAFQDSCDAAFVVEAAAYENDQGSCEGYTEGQYAEIFDRYRNDLCIYNVGDDQQGGHGDTSTGTTGDPDQGTTTTGGTGHGDEGSGSDDTSTEAETGSHGEDSSDETSSQGEETTEVEETSISDEASTDSTSEVEASTSYGEETTEVVETSSSDEASTDSTSEVEASTSYGEGTTEVEETSSSDEASTDSTSEVEETTSYGEETTEVVETSSSDEASTDSTSEVEETTSYGEETTEVVETSSSDEASTDSTSEVEETTSYGEATTEPEETSSSDEASTDSTSEVEETTSYGEENTETGEQSTQTSSEQGVLASESGPDSTDDDANSDQVAAAPLTGPVGLVLVSLGLGMLRRREEH